MATAFVFDVARAEMAARRAAQQAKPATELTGGAACMPGGFPGMMGPVFPLEVLQSPGQVTIIAEAFAQVRRIYLNEKQIAVEDAEPLFWGHSVGHWVGNTLVVNTIGLKETVRVSGVPLPGGHTGEGTVKVGGDGKVTGTGGIK